MSKEYYYVQGERVNITRREGLIAVQFGYRMPPEQIERFRKTVLADLDAVDIPEVIFRVGSLAPQQFRTSMTLPEGLTTSRPNLPAAGTCFTGQRDITWAMGWSG